MKRNRREAIDRDLDALRAEIPDVACRGLCYHSCTIAPASVREREQIAALGHGELPPADEAASRIGADGSVAPCPLLSADRRCLVYEYRPIVCRLWGAAESLRCPHGCGPLDGDVLSDPDALGLLAESIRIGGNPSIRWEFLGTLNRDQAHRIATIYGRQVRKMLAADREPPERRD